MAAPLTRTVASLSLGALLLTGCARTVVQEPVDTSYDSATIGGQLDFFDALRERSGVTNDEAMHGVLLMADTVDETGSYEERVALLKERGWLTDTFDEQANLVMQRGTLAKLLSHMLEIDGGVMMQLTNKHPRYATRELIYLGLLDAGSENQPLSGYAYLDAIGRAEDYVIQQAVKEAARKAQ